MGNFNGYLSVILGRLVHIVWLSELVQQALALFFVCVGFGGGGGGKPKLG